MCDGSWCGLYMPQHPTNPRSETSPPPAVLVVAAEEADRSAPLAEWIAQIREQTDAFVFLSGGASRMRGVEKARLLHLFNAFPAVAQSGMRFAVGDGGTRAGIMEASGLARRASGHLFPLIGICPAPAITSKDEPGKTPIDPNHSHIVAVQNRSWEAARRAEGWTPSDGYWGSETGTMYRVFARLAEGRPSVTLVANGGAIVLDEIRANVDAERSMILVKGSGRAADAVISMLKDTTPSGRDAQQIRIRAQALGLPGPNPALYHVLELSAGPDALARLLRQLLAS